MEKALITGATGYIGSNLTRKLANDGVEVHIVVREQSSMNLLKDVIHKINVHVFNGSIKNMIELVEKAKPDIIFHFAAYFIAEHKSQDIDKLIESNILFGIQILEAAAKNHVQYFVNTGTYWQNFNGESYNPVNLYAASKQAFESMAKYYLETSNLRMLTVKLIDTYGHLDPRPKVMSLFKRISKSGEELEMSLGEQQLGLVYIDDVVKGFIRALHYIQNMQPGEKQTCVIAPHKFNTLKEVAEIFQIVSGKPLNIIWGARKYRPREIMKVDIADLNILEDIETVSLFNGIEMMLKKDL